MQFDWENDDNAPHGIVIDLDTGKPISGHDGYCVFADEETGEWKRVKREAGKIVTRPDGHVIIESGRGRIKFFPKGSPEYDAAVKKLIVGGH